MRAGSRRGPPPGESGVVVRPAIGRNHLYEPYHRDGFREFVYGDGEDVVFYPARSDGWVRVEGDEIVMVLP